MTEELILELSPDMPRELVGGKAYNLSRLLSLGFPVLPGVCLTAALWRQLTNNGISPVRETPSSVRKEICKRLESTWDTLIVRSSGIIEDAANASFAGLFESKVVPHSQEEIIDAIIYVLNSSFSEKVRVYSKTLSLPFPVPMAVLIQPAINTDWFGVGFTQTSPGGAHDKMVLEAIPGIGFPLVGGITNPLRFWINKKSLEVVEVEVPSANIVVQKIQPHSNVSSTVAPHDVLDLISKEKLKHVARLCLDVESKLGQPQDIEWGIKGDQVFLFQSRPITAAIGVLNSFPALTSKSHFITLQGVPANEGKVEGKAWVITTTERFSIPQGRVLVGPTTDPNMVPELIKAAAIVTDRGGIISHAAIISRELGIPCVVGTGNATRVIKTGDKVEVNGSGGIVTVHREVDFPRPPDETREHKGHTFYIFGQEVPIRELWIERQGPLVPEIWDYPWTERFVGKLRFIPPRPEIIASPLTQSIVMPGIEALPYVLKIGGKPLLTTLYRGTIHVELESLKAVLSSLEKRILEYEASFVNAYTQGVLKDYENLKIASKQLLLLSDNLEKHSADDIIQIILGWCRVHNTFFARTYLMQAIGDDLIWPYIRRELIEIVGENEASKTINILLQPQEMGISLQILKDGMKLFDKVPPHFIPVFKSDISDDELFTIVQKSPELSRFLEGLQEFIEKWGWLRTRDFYFPSLSCLQQMLGFLRDNILVGGPPLPNVAENRRRTEDALNMLRKRGNWTLVQIIKLGIYLNHHRNEHFYLWIKYTQPLVNILLRLGERLVSKHVLEEPRDIFFLFMWEVKEALEPENARLIIGEIVESRKMYFLAANKAIELPAGKKGVRDGYWQ